MEVFAVGRDERYKAKGRYEEGELIVLKGSKISGKYSKLLPNVIKIRKDKKIVSSKMILLEDVSFKSASTAANFVTGYICNGMEIWKDAQGETLGKITPKS